MDITSNLAFKKRGPRLMPACADCRVQREPPPEPNPKRLPNFFLSPLPLPPPPSNTVTHTGPSRPEAEPHGSTIAEANDGGAGTRGEGGLGLVRFVSAAPFGALLSSSTHCVFSWNSLAYMVVATRSLFIFGWILGGQEEGPVILFRFLGK